MSIQIDNVISKAILASEQDRNNNDHLSSGSKMSTSTPNRADSKSLATIRSVKQLNLRLTRLWRRYGVKLSFFFTFYLIWNGFTTTVVDQRPESTVQDFSRLQWLWLASHRLVTLFIVNFTLPGFVSLLLYTLPGEGYDDADDEEERGETNLSTKRNQERRPVKVILRIVTRGDYPKLIKDNIEYHENLFKSHWRHDSDEIEIHLTTEKPFGFDRGRTNEAMHHRCVVKEFVVPQDYKSPNGSLYKARNSTYALARCLEEARDSHFGLDRTWVIYFDEDVFLTRRWIREFDDFVLCSNNYDQYKFVNSPSRPIFLDATQGICTQSSWFPPIVPFFGETFRFAMDISRVWWQAKLFGRSSVGLRGSCYGIRLDVERRIGYDCGGPFLSIGEDTTFIHQLMAQPDVKLKFLDAWFLEGAPNSASAFMTQRSRWVRNYLYSLLFAPVPPMNKIRLASFLITWTVIMPYGVLTWGSGYIMMALQRLDVVDFFPCGPSWPMIDAITCVSAACVIYWYIYGCALLLPWYLAVLVSLTFSTYIPVFPLHAIGAVAAVWGLVGGVRELTAGRTEFAFTEKKAV